MSCIICCRCCERDESQVQMWGLVICPNLREGAWSSERGLEVQMLGPDSYEEPLLSRYHMHLKLSCESGS